MSLLHGDFSASASFWSLKLLDNTPDKIRRTEKICLWEWNIGHSSTRIAIEKAEISYLAIVEQQSKVV